MKKTTLAAEYDALMKSVSGCRHPVSPDNEHSYGAALARLENCRSEVREFMAQHPRLSGERAETLKLLLAEIERQCRRVRALRKAAGYKAPKAQKIITVWDLVPTSRPSESSRKS